MGCWNQGLAGLFSLLPQSRPPGLTCKHAAFPSLQLLWGFGTGQWSIKKYKYSCDIGILEISILAGKEELKVRSTPGLETQSGSVLW